MKDSGNSNDYQIVIIECCQNCETHQNFARHSEWKYFEQFNQLKRKIEKFILNTIVIKNPVPDELIKTTQIKNQKNLFVNKDTNEKIIFPRIGSFEIYIYNILIFSKLMVNQWPNHYKILQTVAKMIEEKKKGISLDHFSVYYQPQQNIPKQQSKQIDSPQRRNHRIVSKKKKAPSQLANKAYKSIDKSNEYNRDQVSTLEPISAKLIDIQNPIPQGRNKRIFNNRYLESKADTRVKLPSLNNTVNLKPETKKQKKQSSQDSRIYEDPKGKKNSINEISSGQISQIPRNFSEISQGQKVSILQLKQQQSFRRNQSLQLKFGEQQNNLKFLENRSVQYSQQFDTKQIMNRSIQYQQQQGFYCDFGLQIDNQILPKDVSYNYVQTQKVQLINQPKPYMLDENVQADIIIKKKEHQRETQTIIKEYVDETISTDLVSVVNRGLQFPQETVKPINQSEVIDTSFHHMFEKRRNLVDNQCYSIDKFQEKATKYKWIGRANLNQNVEDLKKKLFLQCLVFSVYNYFGIKTPQRRLSYQTCSNVVGQKMKQSALHVMTSQNPQIQYPFQFQQCNADIKKYPLSQLITFRSSKQLIKFNNYGGILALAYFLNDFQLFNSANNQIGLVIVNEGVKQIHKLSAFNYQIHPTYKNSDDQVIVALDGNAIKLNRLSQVVQLDFISMLTRITDQQTFSELTKYIQEIFIHTSNTYHQFKSTILSLKLDGGEALVVEDFIKMIHNRLEKVQELFKGKLYTYKKYHSLTPVIKYGLPFENKIERKLMHKQKLVLIQDLVKPLRAKETIIVITGEQGIGKSSILSDLSKLLISDKLNVLQFSQLRRQKSRIRDELFQLTKNVVIIDNADMYQSEALTLLDRYSKTTNFEISYVLATTNAKQFEMLKNRYANMIVSQAKVQLIDNEQMKNYLLKTIKYQSFSAKKDLVDKLFEETQRLKILSNPLYLSLYAHFLSRTDCENYKVIPKYLTRYMILKEHFSFCTTLHMEQMKNMNIKIKEVLPNLRRLAFQFYHNDLQPSETIKQILNQYEENQLIRSQLVYYPLNLQSVISTSYQPLFTHSVFLHYFLIQAYSYFVEKGYRSMYMQKLYNNLYLMDMIKERYKLEQTYSQLLEVIFNSKKFKNTTQASSNAVTLLTKMGFVFSNMNFDDCNIGQADLSNSTFYQCSFRGADLEKTVLYKAQMISCVFDNALMSKINLFSKKYEIQFAAMATSLSVDGKRIAFGCGNYLIIINSETGAQVKKIEAHLDVIRMVKYTKDGNSLITVADDKTLRIWDIYTFKSVVFKLPQKGSISYSNETETIASVNKTMLKVWNLKSMANEAELDGHSQMITTVQFSYDGTQILTGSRDSTLRLWTLRGQQKIVFKGHDNQILVGKLSPVKRTMVSSSKGKDIIMWQTQTGNKLLSKKFMTQVTQICLQNKEKYIIINFSNQNHLVILDFVNFDILHILAGHQAKVLSISFDHNFRNLISLGKDRTARVWQFNRIMQTQCNNLKANRKIHKGAVLCLAYDKIKKRYATSHQSGQINVWDSIDNTHIDQVFSHNGAVRCLKYDKTGKLYSGGSDGTLRMWTLDIKRQPRSLEIHSSQMIQMKLTEKNRLIATSSMANELVVYDFTGIKIILSTRQQGRLNAIEFSPDEKIMAVGGVQKYVVLYQITNSNTIARTQQLGAHAQAISSLCFFGQTLLVVALKNGHVAIWNHVKASLMKKIENLSPIRDILTFQKKYICFSSDDGKIRIVNMDEGREVKVFRFSQLPTSLDINQDESLLYVGSKDGNVLKWNLNSVKPAGKQIEFDRKAIDINCTKIITIQSGKTLLIKDLLRHRQDIIQVKSDSDIEGVTFDEDRIILLLKNGKYWQFGKKQYKFNTKSQYEGDLFYIRDKNYTNFFKSGLKKIKGMNKPALSVLQEINS